MLELSIRDVGIKGKKLRNKGLVTGTLRRKDGQIIPIFLSSNILEQYIVITDYCKDLDVKFENEIIHVHIKEAQRHFTKNNVINMDFIEI